MDDEVTVEADRISNLPSLRGRFHKPVALGIFVFGASDRSREEENEPDDDIPQSRHCPEVPRALALRLQRCEQKLRKASSGILFAAC